MYTVQISDPSLAPADGTDVRHFRTKSAVLNAWEAGYNNTLDCASYWGGALPAMSGEFTVTVWRGKLTDVTDVYPDAEVTIGRQWRPVWRTIA